MIMAVKKFIYLILVVLVILELLSIAGSYFQLDKISAFFTSGEMQVVLLEPEMKSYKTKPQYPGGIEMPNSDSLVYEKLRDSSKQVGINQVNILPDPEKSIENNLQNLRKLPAQTGDQVFVQEGDKSDVSRIEDEPKFVGSIDDILENIGYYEESFMLPEAEMEVATEGEENKPESGSQVKDEVVAKEDQIGQDQNYGNIKVSKSYSSVHHTDVESLHEGVGQGYLIQLAIARSSDQASKVWAQIQSKNYKILAQNTLVVKKFSSKENKIFYLVLTGPYPSEYKAKLVCSSLKKKQQNCIITK